MKLVRQFPVGYKIFPNLQNADLGKMPMLVKKDTKDISNTK